MDRGGVLAAAFLLGAGVASALWAVLSPSTPRPSRAEDPDADRRIDTPGADGPEAPLAEPPPLAGRAPARVEDLRPSEEEGRFLMDALARERLRVEKARILAEDSGIRIVERHRDHGADLLDLMRSHDAFRARVRTESVAPHSLRAAGNPTFVRLQDAKGDPLTIEFGEGTFVVDDMLLGNVRDRVRSLEIRGAGMDRTTLRARGDLLLVTGSLENVWIHDLTFLGEQVLDGRGAFSAAIERVRFRDWPSGGHGAPIGVSGTAYLALSDCEFLGTHEGGSYAVSVRGDAVARFERCLFQDVRGAVLNGWDGVARDSVAVFQDCTFDGSRVLHGGFQHRGRPEFPVHVRGGRVTFGDRGQSEEVRRSAWGAGQLAELTGVAFEPQPVRCSLADMGRVLSELEEAVPGTFLGFSMVSPRRAERTTYHVVVFDDRLERLTTIEAIVATGEKVAVDDRGYRSTEGSSAEYARLLDVREALRRAGLSADTDVAEVKLQEMVEGTKSARAYWIGKAWPAAWMIDAVTGAVIRRP